MTMSNIFSCKGKAARTEFWAITIFCIALICITGPMIDLIESSVGHTMAIFFLVFCVCYLMSTVTTRRCHDLGFSSWKQFDPRYCLKIPFGKSK